MRTKGWGKRDARGFEDEDIKNSLGADIGAHD
jgi:hypothetical protein